MLRDTETVRLLQAVWDALGVIKGYLGWLWFGSGASMLALGVGLVNAAALAWVVRRMIKWEGAGK